MRLVWWVVCVAACGHPFELGSDASESLVDMQTHDTASLDGEVLPTDASTHDALVIDAAAIDAGISSPLAIEPSAIHVPAGRDQPFVASSAVTWSVMEPGGGVIDAEGTYIAPEVPGTYHVIATDSDGHVAIGTVVVEQMVVTLITGGLGGWGTADGYGATARFIQPRAIAYDGVGTMFVGDNHTVRAIDVATKRVTTLAGGAPYTQLDGVGESAFFGAIWDLAYDATTKRLYVSDRQYGSIRMIDVASRAVTTIAGGSPLGTYVDGPGATARFRALYGLCLSGTTLYVADGYGETIRTVDIASPTYEVATLAGKPLVAGFDNASDPQQATFSLPADVACTPTMLYVADYKNGAIRTIDRATGEVATLVGSPTSTFGDGDFSNAGLGGPSYLFADPAAGQLYTSAAVRPVMRKIDLSAHTVTSLGDSAYGFELVGSQLWYTRGDSHDVGTLDLATHAYASVAGKSPYVSQGTADGPLSEATFIWPQQLAVSLTGDVIVSSDYTMRRLSLWMGNVTTFGGLAGMWGYTDGGLGVARLDGGGTIAIDPQGRTWQSSPGGAVIRQIDADGTVTARFGYLGQHGSADGVGSAARFNLPEGLVWVNGKLIVADMGDATIRSIDLSTGTVTTIAGVAGLRETVDGHGTNAHFQYPFAMATDGKSRVWIGDEADHGSVIRELDLVTGAVTTIAGNQGSRGVIDGVGSAAHFCLPYAMAYDGANSLYIADLGGDQYDRQVAAIRRVWLPSHAVSTVAGQGIKYGAQLGPVQTATLAQPYGIAISPSGNVLFTGENAIFAIVSE